MQKPLSDHAQHLPASAGTPIPRVPPRSASCAAPASRSPGDDALRPGIAAVTDRLQAGTLKVIAGRCPNLVSESQLSRYGDDPTDRRSEAPVDEHNHALAALRYLITKLDARHMIRLKNTSPPSDPSHPSSSSPPPSPPSPPARKPWLRYDNEALWAPLT